jgi:hypothetical protein
MKAAVALNHWSWPCAPHHAETRLCISLPFSISFIANIARKRPELNRDKTRSRHGHRNDAHGSEPSMCSNARVSLRLAWERELPLANLHFESSYLRLASPVDARRSDCNRFAKVFMVFNSLHAAMNNLGEISSILSLRVQ